MARGEFFLGAHIKDCYQSLPHSLEQLLGWHRLEIVLLVQIQSDNALDFGGARAAYAAKFSQQCDDVVADEAEKT